MAWIIVHSPFWVPPSLCPTSFPHGVRIGKQVSSRNLVNYHCHLHFTFTQFCICILYFINNLPPESSTLIVYSVSYLIPVSTQPDHGGDADGDAYDDDDDYGSGDDDDGDDDDDLDDNHGGGDECTLTCTLSSRTCQCHTLQCIGLQLFLWSKSCIFTDCANCKPINIINISTGKCTQVKL